MELKPGYKQTKVGPLPNEWDAALIGEMFTFKNGLNKAKKYFGYGTPIINYMDVFSYPWLSMEQVKGRVDVNKQELKAFEVSQGDVFFTRTSETVEEIGVASVMLDKPTDTVFSGFVLRARPTDDSLDNQFKKYCFSSSVVRKQITSKSTYTTRALTNGQVLSAVRIPKPPTLDEQRAIAAALSNVDEMITSLDALIAKKRDIKQATMQQLLTGKTRLPGFSGEWVEHKFGDVAKIRNEKVNTFKTPCAEFCVELEQIGQNTGQIDGFADARGRISSKYRFHTNDVLFGRLRPYLRKFWMADRSGVCSTEIWPIIPTNNGILPSYLYQVVRTDAFIEAAKMAYGTHMPRADWNVLRKQIVKIPQKPAEQETIGNVVFDMDTEIVALEDKHEKTRALKQGMMQELLTGRIRLV